MGRAHLCLPTPLGRLLDHIAVFWVLFWSISVSRLASMEVWAPTWTEHISLVVVACEERQEVVGVSAHVGRSE
jgi:hypothetical protein